MYGADPSALVETGQKVVRTVKVDLIKRIQLDVVYSDLMQRRPRVPRFEQWELEDDE